MKFEILLFLLTSFFMSQFVCAQALEKQLIKADSLFEKERYTQALEIYDDIHSQELASPAMLVKMAYIYEALGNSPKVNQLLLQYNNLTHSEIAKERVRKLADENNYQGYQASDFDFFHIYLKKYFNHLLAIVFGLIFLVAVITIYRKWQFKKINKGLLLIQIALLSILLLINNMSIPQEAILNANNNYLMKDASSAAEVKLILGAGHKVKILNEDRVWTKVELENEIYYIRNDQLLKI